MEAVFYDSSSECSQLLQEWKKRVGTSISGPHTPRRKSKSPAAAAKAKVRAFIEDYKRGDMEAGCDLRPVLPEIEILLGLSPGRPVGSKNKTPSRKMLKLYEVVNIFANKILETGSVSLPWVFENTKYGEYEMRRVLKMLSNRGKHSLWVWYSMKDDMYYLYTTGSAETPDGWNGYFRKPKGIPVDEE